MRLAVLYSGGKDSTFAAYIMEQMGYSITDLVGILPSDPYSWLFHTPNLNLLPIMAKSMGKTLTTASSSGSEDSDLEALRQVLARLEVDGVVTGAIASDYQWDRINGVCEDLGLRTYSPLWRKEQLMILREMIDADIKAVIVGTYAEGLDEHWLGRQIDHRTLRDLERLSAQYGINPSGEGGEYETLVLDSPMHAKEIKIVRREIEVSKDVSRMMVTEARLEDKI